MGLWQIKDGRYYLDGGEMLLVIYSSQEVNKTHINSTQSIQLEIVIIF